MPNHWFCRLALVSLLIMGPSHVVGQAKSEARSRPNIVFIMTDDHAVQAMSCYGSRINRTPQLDRLANGGMRFDRAYCTNSICAPSRAVILTGKLSHKNGVFDNNQDFDGSQTTLQSLLKSAGYSTAMIGKWHLKTLPTGFDHYMVLPGQGHYVNPDFIEDGQRLRIEGYVTDLVTDEAIRWMRRRPQDRPFMLMLQHKAPHRNWIPPERHLTLFDGETIPEPATLFDDYEGRGPAASDQEMTIDRHLHQFYDLKDAGGPTDDGLGRAMTNNMKRMSDAQRGRYLAAYAKKDREEPMPVEPAARVRWKYQRYIKDYLRCIAAVDENIGRVLDYLEESGLAENTIVVYTSDQGFYLGEHGWFDKRFIYEESSRMPLLVRWPGHIPAGKESGALIMNSDFAPTLLDMAGLEAPKDMQGTSFAQIATTGVEPESWRDATYYHYYEYPGVHAVKRHYGLITKRYKLAHYYHDVDTWELIDREADPAELKNVFDDPAYATVAASLRRRLAELQVQYDEDPEAILRGLRPAEITNQAKGLAYRLTTPPAPRYAKNAAKVLTDGLHRPFASTAPAVRDGWLGFKNRPFEVTLDLGSVREVSSVGIHCLNEPTAWIYFPTSVSVATSDDGVKFSMIEGAPLSDSNPSTVASQVVGISKNLRARYFKITATPLKRIPDGAPGAAQPGWLFVDEIVIR